MVSELVMTKQPISGHQIDRTNELLDEVNMLKTI